jgi:hypothetical protein
VAFGWRLTLPLDAIGSERRRRRSEPEKKAMSEHHSAIDRVAREILFRKYWNPKGGTDGTITEAEFEYAKRAGLMFDPVDMTHDGAIERALELRRTISPDRVARAFLASLSSRRLDWRSALGSYSAILHLPAHRFTSMSNPHICGICAQFASSPAVDVSALNFRRLKWGGVLHEEPHYAVVDLEWFAALEVPGPNERDLHILSTALANFANLQADARPAELEKSLRGLLPSNRSERRILIEILALAGILIPKNRPTFWGEYPLQVDREFPHKPWKTDWRYPVVWWKGADGVNRDAVAFWFPMLS